MLVAALAASALVGSIALAAFAGPKAAWNAARAEYVLPSAKSVRRPDLTVDFTADLTSVRVGRQLTYTGYVTNNGLRGATNVHLHLTLPANVQVLLTSTDRGPGCSPKGERGLDCDLDAIPTGKAGVVVVKVVVRAGGTLATSARATEHETDRHPKDNKASETTTVAGGGARAHVTADSTVQIGGTGSKDKITGTAGSDAIDGKSGNDVINGGSGNDTIKGGSGNDTITGGPGADRIYGGAGNDTIYAKDGARDTIDCGGGRDTVYADKKDSVAHNCEVVRRS